MSEQTEEMVTAIAVLEDKGLIGQERPGDELRDLEFDRLLTGRPEAVKFDEPGQFVLGIVVEKLTQQKRDYDSGNPLWEDDGRPKLEGAIILHTDDGLVTLYMSSWRLEKAVGEAVRASGRRRLERGGQLVVRMTGLGEAVTLKSGKKAKPPKEYEAAYDPPGGGNAAAVAAEVNAPELGPPQQASFASEISAECVGGDCRDCDSRRCSHDCHRASRPPEQLAETDGPPPF